MSQEMGESNGGQSDLDGLPMGSIVYMGRGSFRMEAVAVDADLERRQGVVQPLAGVVVTAPMHAGERGRRQDRERDQEEDPMTSTGSWQAPDLRPLFSSQVDVPLLAAPIGSAGFSATPISISRVALAALSGLVLLCGVVIGTAVRHLLASPAAISTVSVPAPSAAPIIVAEAPVAALVALPAPAAEAPVVTAPVVTAPVVIQTLRTPPVTAVRAHPRPAVKRAPVETVRKAPAQAIAGSASHWVDPFAE
jgi:hypothetical protein